MANIGTQELRPVLRPSFSNILGSTVLLLIVLEWYLTAPAAWVAVAHQGKQSAVSAPRLAKSRKAARACLCTYEKTSGGTGGRIGSFRAGTCLALGCRDEAGSA